MAELKPCLRCGGKGEIGECWDGFFVRCRVCRYSTPPFRPKKKDMAVKTWNRRVGDAQTPSEG